MNPPLFAFGAPRSGTTALARALSAHPQVQILHELRVLEIGIIAGHLLQPGLPHTDEGHGRALMAGAPVARGVLAQRRHALGVPWIGDKYPPYAGQTKALEHVFPGFRAIVIVRDPRDVAASIRTTTAQKRVWRLRAGRATMEQALDTSVAFLESALGAAERLGERAFLIGYEEAARDPGAVCARFEAFLGLPASPELREAMAGIKPTKDWRTSLSEAEKAVAARHARTVQMVKRLGYAPTPEPADPDPDSPARCLARAEAKPPKEAALELCRALDGDWSDPAVPEAARRLVALDVPEAFYGLAHLVEHGQLADREPVQAFLRGQGLSDELARAVTA